MLASKEYFQTTGHAQLYKQYRREATLKCIQRTIDFLAEKVDPKRCCAIDVGCGSGQATYLLAPYLKQVVGVDVSEAQLIEARKDPRAKINTNVEFKVSEAENLPLENESVHLVFAKSAAHWFDYERFCKEVDRVLAPNGVLALCTNNKPLTLVGQEEKSEKLEQILEELREKCRKTSHNNSMDWTSFYNNLELPYKCYIRDYSMADEYEISVADHIGYYRTLSGINNFICLNPREGELMMKEATDKLMKLLQSDSVPEKAMMTFRRPSILLLSRKQ